MRSTVELPQHEQYLAPDYGPSIEFSGVQQARTPPELNSDANGYCKKAK
jgi:hypothetical protein